MRGGCRGKIRFDAPCSGLADLPGKCRVIQQAVEGCCKFPAMSSRNQETFNAIVDQSLERR